MLKLDLKFGQNERQTQFVCLLPEHILGRYLTQTHEHYLHYLDSV